MRHDDRADRRYDHEERGWWLEGKSNASGSPLMKNSAQPKRQMRIEGLRWIDLGLNRCNQQRVRIARTSFIRLIRAFSNVRLEQFEFDFGAKRRWNYSSYFVLNYRIFFSYYFFQYFWFQNIFYIFPSNIFSHKARSIVGAFSIFFPHLLRFFPLPHFLTSLFLHFLASLLLRFRISLHRIFEKGIMY